MSTPLAQIYDGWNGYQTSLVHAVARLTSDQLSWRPGPDRRSTGELVRHMSSGRVNWFSRMGAPGVEALVAMVPEWATDGDGVRHVVEGALPAHDGASLVAWLELSWQSVRRVLDEWSVQDLVETYRHRFRGKVYANSRQWTIWRIMTHDIHHGGQLAMMLGLRGIEAFELRALGGHITTPSLADSGNDEA